jgi:hypothetical protein
MFVGALAALVSCYDTHPVGIKLVSEVTELDCFETADRVFSDANYGRVDAVSGPERFYTPHTNPGAALPLALHWGIAVTINGKSRTERGQCTYELHALSIDPDCGIQCPLTPQPGAEYERTVKEMAAKLATTFGRPATK